MSGGRQDSQTRSEILTAPQDTTSTNKDLKETVINLSDQTLDDEIYS
jgi:hypothetical protein